MEREERLRAFRDRKSKCSCGGMKQRVKGAEPPNGMLGVDVYVGNSKRVQITESSFGRGSLTALGLYNTDATIKNAALNSQTAVQVSGDSPMKVSDVVHRPEADEE
jgi:hypothetical protein